MTKSLTRVDDHLIEVHFARETIVVERFSVTTMGWHNVWLMTKYDGAYARTDEVMLRSDAIVWSRYVDVMSWVEIDDANLIPIRTAGKKDASKVTLHLGHEEMYDKDNPDQCPVTTREILGYGWIYSFEEE